MKAIPFCFAWAVISLTNSIASEPVAASRNIPVTEAAELLANDKTVVVLDIRTPEEFEKGHIQGAKLIDYMADDFESKIGKLNKDVTYLMHCASGGRSGRAMKKFRKAGFKSVLHLKEGFRGWQAAGQPVAR